jgi:hypothetical protein
MRNEVERILLGAFDARLTKSILDAFFEIKKNYYLERHRPTELEAGRFCEACMRCLQQMGTGKYTPLSKKLRRFDDEVGRLELLDATNIHESIRIHIPRLLQSVYRIRNRRDVGHIGGDVSPNESDCVLVVSVCSWALAEIVRIIYNCPITEAQSLVDALIEREVPILQEFDGALKVLNPKLTAGDKILAILYAKSAEGATTEELLDWIRPTKEPAFRSAISRLEHQKAYIYRSGNECKITKAGIKYVENKSLFRNC